MFFRCLLDWSWGLVSTYAPLRNYVRKPCTLYPSPVERVKVFHRAGPAKAVIDVTPVDHHPAAAALRLGIPYLGIAMTEIHAQKLKLRVKQYVFHPDLWGGPES